MSGMLTSAGLLRTDEAKLLIKIKRYNSQINLTKSCCTICATAFYFINKSVEEKELSFHKLQQYLNKNLYLILYIHTERANIKINSEKNSVKHTV